MSISCRLLNCCLWFLKLAEDSDLFMFYYGNYKLFDFLDVAAADFDL